jgi:CheY-like chemotaxis protein
LSALSPGVLPANTTERIMLVDDDPMKRLIVAQTLDHAGFTTTRSSDGEEALNLIIIDCLP